MATIVTRQGKGSKLTIVEMDDNFENLNTQGEDNAAAINSLETDKQDALGYVPVPNSRTINGKPLTGNVSLAKADVGLSAVDNTSDAAKPVSTATQTALDGKASTGALSSGLALKANITYVDTGLSTKATPEDIEVAIDNATTVYDGDTFEGKNFPIPGPDDPAIGTIENPIRGKGGGIPPVDAVEDGNMNPVTSNAVYDSISDVRGGESRTMKQIYDELFALISSGLENQNPPIDGVVDDVAKTFGWTNVGGKTDADTEKTFDGGLTVEANSDNPFSVPNANYATGQVGVRYKAISGFNPSPWLYNDVVFTEEASSAIVPIIFQSLSSGIEYNEAANSYKFNYVSGGEGWGNGVWNSGKKLLAGVDGGVYMKGGNSGSGLSTRACLGFVTQNTAAGYGPGFDVGFSFAQFEYPGIGFIDNASGTIDFSDGINFVNGTDYRLWRTSGVWKVESSTDNWATVAVVKTLTYTSSVDMYPVGDIRAQEDSSAILTNPRCSDLNNV